MFQILLTGLIAFGAGTRTEVQVNICESSQELSRKLELQTWTQEETEESYLIENKNLELYNNSWVFKAKINTSEDTVDIILKHNQADPTATMADSRKCEYDLHGTHKKYACKIENKISLAEFNTLQNTKSFPAMLSNEQLEWLNAENQPLPSDLEITTAFQDQGYTQKTKELKIQLGISTNTKRTEFTEISTRSKSTEDQATQQKLVAYLKTKNITLCADQGPLLTKLKLQSHFN